jgi:hypothetical protein
MVAALPFETPKLAVTATVSEHNFATLLEVDKSALPRLVDRRYRRV